MLTLSLIKTWPTNSYLVTSSHIAKERETGRIFVCTDMRGATPFCKGVLLTVLIRRVQRCVRRHMAAKSLAVMMCSHARLGGWSILSMLPVDILREKIQEEVEQCHDVQVRGALLSKELEQLVVRLYEYCEELNIIKRRIEKLKFYSDKR
jgi:hypothetical protein